jgi:hypothetical protein
VSRESLRPTAGGHRTCSNLQPVYATAICRVCRRGRLSAFTAAGCGEPRRFAANCGERAPPATAGQLLIFRHNRRDPSWGRSSIGRKDRAAIASVRRTRSADDQIHSEGFARGSGEVRLKALAASGRGSGTRIAAKPVRAATGMTGALIFELFRARLPAQSPAMAASEAPRSTQ